MVAALSAALLLGLAMAPVAYAHPLGNFSVNHYDALRLLPDRIEDTAVVDSAEIPTAQDHDATDRDHDGQISETEAASRAGERCTELARDTRTKADGRPLTWHPGHSALTYGKGAAGLPIARLTCALHADADLSRPTTVTFASAAEATRTGWKEITATGVRVRLTSSSVPSGSPSDGLRSYPASAIDRPLDTVIATIRTTPFPGAALGPGAEGSSDQQAAAPASARGTMLFPAVENRLTALTAHTDLTWTVGLLAVLLALLLGAGHAVLPGHAKLAVAACLARREGGGRAALAVGATVTLTHTAGVLAVGMALTVFSGFAGERLLGWLGGISGALIILVGTALVISALRALHTGHISTHQYHAHSHTHSHGHGHHGHEVHGTRRSFGLPSLLGVGLAGGLVPSPSALIILLGAIALSHTYFGVLLVLGYGLGMAVTLTAAGLLLAEGGNRLTTLAQRRLPSLGRYTRYTSLLTALAVLTVGIGLTLRNLLLL